MAVTRTEIITLQITGTDPLVPGQLCLLKVSTVEKRYEVGRNLPSEKNKPEKKVERHDDGQFFIQGESISFLLASCVQGHVISHTV